MMMMMMMLLILIAQWLSTAASNNNSDGSWRWLLDCHNNDGDDDIDYDDDSDDDSDDADDSDSIFVGFFINNLSKMFKVSTFQKFESKLSMRKKSRN